VSGASALGQSIRERDDGIEALDGLRGVAAVGVMLYHLGGWTGRPWLMAHGYLAVDFFFCLSGFVLAHAYEPARNRLVGLHAPRLIRLWPLIALTMLAGATVIIQHRERVPDLAAWAC
jgi:peptidoglycan/LPS O-acetylase OafA/YrhL